MWMAPMESVDASRDTRPIQWVGLRDGGCVTPEKIQSFHLHPPQGGCASDSQAVAPDNLQISCEISEVNAPLKMAFLGRQCEKRKITSSVRPLLFHWKHSSSRGVSIARASTTQLLCVDWIKFLCSLTKEGNFLFPFLHKHLLGLIVFDRFAMHWQLGMICNLIC